MKRALIIAAMMFGTLAIAQDCPVEIHDANAEAGMPSITSFSYSNTTKKIISAIKFRIVQYDAMGEPVTDTEYTLIQQTLNPGQRRVSKYNSQIQPRTGDRYGVEVWVDRVLFDDGTSWEDKGQQRCYWSVKAGKKAKVD